MLPLLLATALCIPQATPTPTPFPLTALDHAGAHAPLPPDQALLGQIQAAASLFLVDVLLPSGPVDLRLQRADSPRPAGIIVHRNGAPVGARAPAFSSWAGTIEGEANTSVWLSFSGVGSWGWIRRGNQLLHLCSHAGPDGRWLDYRSRWVDDASLAEEQHFSCDSHAEALAEFASRAEQLRPGPGPRSDGDPLLGARLALETDWQFFQLFGDLAAAEAYTRSLLDAIAHRYREQVGVLLLPVYLGFHDDPDDGWISPDSDTSTCSQVLSEFRAAWRNGGAPVRADVYHLLSGGGSLGGCAGIDTLCDQNRSFGVTMQASGSVDFPVGPSPLNYDFVIVAHELGHNFGSVHTHETCPPIDECAPPGAWGPCQDEQSHTDQATLMSYCGTCPGGFANFTTWFHPDLAAVMRAAAEASCLEEFEGILVTDLGHGLAGGPGAPRIQAQYRPRTERLQLHCSDVAPSAPGILVVATSTVFLPLFGGTLVPAIELLLPVAADASGQLTVQGTVSGSFPEGVLLYTQAWFNDSAAVKGLSATPGLQIEIIRP